MPSSDPNARLLILRAMGIVGDPTDEDEDDTQAIALFDQYVLERRILPLLMLTVGLVGY